MSRKMLGDLLWSHGSVSTAGLYVEASCGFVEDLTGEEDLAEIYMHLCHLPSGMVVAAIFMRRFESLHLPLIGALLGDSSWPIRSKRQLRYHGTTLQVSTPVGSKDYPGGYAHQHEFLQTFQTSL